MLTKQFGLLKFITKKSGTLEVEIVAGDVKLSCTTVWFELNSVILKSKLIFDELAA